MGTQILAGLLFIKHNARRCSSASSEKRVIASTSHSTVHRLELLLITVPRIEVSRGRLSAEVKSARFYVVSKDTGFDPLIRYLGKQGIRCERITNVTDKAQPKVAAKLPSMAEQVSKVKANLLKRPAARPRTSKTLRSSINALFAKKLTTDQQESLVAELISSGFLSELNGKITYAASV